MFLTASFDTDIIFRANLNVSEILTNRMEAFCDRNWLENNTILLIAAVALLVKDTISKISLSPLTISRWFNHVSQSIE